MKSLCREVYEKAYQLDRDDVDDDGSRWYVWQEAWLASLKEASIVMKEVQDYFDKEANRTEEAARIEGYDYTYVMAAKTNAVAQCILILQKVASK